MIPAIFAIHRVEVQNPVYVQEYGDEYATWPDGDGAVWFPVDRVFIENGDTSEDNDRADGELAEWTVYGDLSSVGADARVRFQWQGEEITTHVDGRPKYHDAPVGLGHHVARLRSREG